MAEKTSQSVLEAAEAAAAEVAAVNQAQGAATAGGEVDASTRDGSVAATAAAREVDTKKLDTEGAGPPAGAGLSVQKTVDDAGAANSTGAPTVAGEKPASAPRARAKKGGGARAPRPLPTRSFDPAPDAPMDLVLTDGGVIVTTICSVDYDEIAPAVDPGSWTIVPAITIGPEGEGVEGDAVALISGDAALFCPLGGRINPGAGRQFQLPARSLMLCPARVPDAV